MKAFLLRSLPAVAAALVIAGCGGGSSTGTAGTKSTLSGTAATGAPAAGGNVSASCGAASATGTTAADGTWSVSLTNATYPCLVTVSGGSLPAGMQLHGYATSNTNVDVTPLTSLIGAYANNAANGGALTQAILDAASKKVVDALTAAGFTGVPADPLTASFAARNGDAYDDLLEALMLSLSQQGTTLSQVTSEITQGGAPQSGELITPSVTAFDSTPDPLPANVTSYGLEAAFLASLGDRITLAPSTTRKELRSVTVAMSSWACQSGGPYTNDCVSAANATFSHPVTLNIYDDNTNTLLATRTQTFTMPYRPSADGSCTSGKWKAADGSCNYGKAFKIAFDLRSLNLTLPDNIRYELSYNTSHYGPQPIGVVGPYDALSVGLFNATSAHPTVGTDPEPGFLSENGAPVNEGYGIMAQFQFGS